MTEKDRISKLFVQIIMENELSKMSLNDFRKAINDNQPPIREGLIKLREKYKSMFNDYEEIYWEGSAEDLSDVLE
jgi:hypothetical protein